jgi:hypothetical protein
MKTAGTAVTGTWGDKLEMAAAAGAAQITGQGHTVAAIRQVRAEGIMYGSLGYTEARRALWHLSEAAVELGNLHQALGRELATTGDHSTPQAKTASP